MANKKPVIAIGLLQSNTSYDFKKMKVMDTELRRYAIALNSKGGLSGKRVHIFSWINPGRVSPEAFAKKRIEMLKDLKGPLIIINKEVVGFEGIKNMLHGMKVFTY